MEKDKQEGAGKRGNKHKASLDAFVYVCVKESWEKDGAGACSAGITQLALLARSSSKNILLEEVKKWNSAAVSKRPEWRC